MNPRSRSGCNLTENAYVQAEREQARQRAQEACNDRRSHGQFIKAELRNKAQREEVRQQNVRKRMSRNVQPLVRRQLKLLAQTREEAAQRRKIQRELNEEHAFQVQAEILHSKLKTRQDYVQGIEVRVQKELSLVAADRQTKAAEAYKLRMEREEQQRQEYASCIEQLANFQRQMQERVRAARSLHET